MIENSSVISNAPSLIVTLTKSISNDENQTKRINARKIASLKDLFNSSINEVSFEIKSNEELEELSKILNEDGKTIVNINLLSKNNILKFKLKNTRKLDRKSLNLLRKHQIQAIIS